MFRLKPASIRLDGGCSLAVREAIFARPPTLERMRRRGFELAGQTEKLHDKDIELRVPTLPVSPRMGRQKAKRQDTPPPSSTEIAQISDVFAAQR